MIRPGFRNWLWMIRDSSRIAFILRCAGLLGNTLLFLLWNRLLLQTLGDAAFGTFMAFMAFMGLAGLGNFGLGGAVAMRAGQFLGAGDEKGLKEFLASARAFYVVVAVLVTSLLALQASFLPQWLGFEQVPGTGSLRSLFLVGACGMGFLLLSNYFDSLNYGIKNLTWPMLPGFFVPQLVIGSHVILAWKGAPLWIQYLPYVTGMVVHFVYAWGFVRIYRKDLAVLFPLRFEPGRWKDVLGSSFWTYLCALGSLIYVTTDRMLINAMMGPEQVPRYFFNYKLCEISVSLIWALSFAVLPKLTQLLARPEAAGREEAWQMVKKVQQLQGILTAALALGYLWFNDVFMGLWLGQEYRVSIWLQGAFVLNLVIIGSADAGVQAASRMGRSGIKHFGVIVVLSALLNLGLSALALKFDWLIGVALATALAQLIQVIYLGHYSIRNLGQSYGGWFLRTTLWPLLFLGVAFICRLLVPGNGFGSELGLAVIYAALLALWMKTLGLSLGGLLQEWVLVKNLLFRKQ